jgi:hypothetical protein
LPCDAYTSAARLQVQWVAKNRENLMPRWIALLALAAALGGCAHAPASQPPAVAQHSWNDGVWNSVLGYVGPANVVVAGGPSGR